MRFNDDAELDASQVEDRRGVGGGGGSLGGLAMGRLAMGGGGLGLVGLVIFLVLSQLGGGGAADQPLGMPQPGQQRNATDLSRKCKTGADANSDHDCALVATINSIQSYWSDQLSRSGITYRLAPTVFFNGRVDTGGCGSATSAVGPFYCPVDSTVYIDLGFFNDLTSRFGARGGPFVEAYVLAHEYGHHVQNLLGTSKSVRGNATGPASGSVRLELQADCYAGVWANHASTAPGRSGKPLISDITQDDITRALDAAARIGDDYIQSQLGGKPVDPSKFSHGTSDQRRKWFTTGVNSGNPTACNTFDTSNL